MKKKNLLIYHRNKVLFLPFLFMMFGSLFAQKSGLDSKLQKIINSFVEDTLLYSASVSISIIDIETNKLIGTHDPNRSLVPASSLKVITAASLLDIAGEDFTYKTKFYLQGTKNQDSSFSGNIIVEGVGDPSFCSYSQEGAMGMQELVNIFKQKLFDSGIRHIRGNIIVNSNYIKDIPENPEWLWYDLGNYYGAGCHSLNVYENLSWVSIREERRSGQICEVVKVVPSILEDYYCSEVLSSTIKSDEDIFVLGSSQNKYYTIQGSILCCGSDTLTLKAAIPDPSIVFQKIFKQKLKETGVKFSDYEKSNEIPSKLLVYIYESPILRKLCERALKKSVNLYCESFVHTFGDLSINSTDRKKSLESIENYWNSKGLDKSMVLEDGSGLSPKDLMSSLHLAKALQSIAKNPRIPRFWELLPESSSEGALMNVIPDKAKSKLRLKSGSMERVRSFSGYIMNKDKPKYAVALIVNYYPCTSDQIKKKIGNFFTKLADY
jgi:D-alanyl-D-alanine carboxypeptidase/D-alanyl-D-alanine-endopeptidase (penicillin-binding protein 4)